MTKPVYRASEAGLCRRVLGAMRLGYEPLPPSPQQERIMRESSRHEDWLIEDLLKDGKVVWDRQKLVRIEDRLIAIEGHLDGIIANSAGSKVLEVKALGRFAFERVKRKGMQNRQYLYQIAYYMAATKMPCLLLVKCRDTGEVLSFEFQDLPVKLDDIFAHLNLVEAFAQQFRLLEGEYEEDSEECRYCRYKFLCLRQPEGRAEKPSQLPDEVLEAFELVKQELELREGFRQARETIRQYMEANDLGTLRASGLVARLISKERTSYDQKVLFAHLPKEVIERAKIVTPYRELRIREE
jgi:hypothetical protein